MGNRSIRLISPISLVVLIWSLTLIVGLLPLIFPDNFQLALYFINRQATLSSDFVADFTLIAALWLILMFVTFVVANLITVAVLPSRPRPFDTSTDFDQAAWLTFVFNIVLVLIVLLWVFLTARQMGGFRALILLVQLDVLEAREELLGNKLFTGMRLLYGGLPATGTLAAAILAAGKKTGQISSFSRRLCLFTLLLDLALLTVLPIVMSQRLLLVILIMGSYFSVCMVHRKLVGLQYLPIGIGLFLTTWILRESLSNATIEESAVSIGLQKLVFYFTNDLLNSFMPLNEEFEHAYGYFSLRFLLFYTQTDGIFQELLSDKLAQINNVRGGGAWSIFVMPYVDFGPVGAAIFVAILAVITRIFFHKGTENVFWAAAYGHVAAAFVLSTHTNYFSNANFTALLIFTWIIAHMARKRSIRIKIDAHRSA